MILPDEQHEFCIATELSTREPARFDADDAEAIGLLERLGRALHQYGSPAHRLEAALTGVAERMGIDGQFLVTPTSILAVVEPRSGGRRTIMIRSPPGEVDLARLAKLESIVDDLVRRDLPLTEASARLESLLTAPSRYGPVVMTSCFALASGGAARFFDGGWREVLAAIVTGAAIGLVGLVAQRRPSMATLFEPLAATLAAFMATAASRLIPGVSAEVALLGGLIVLIPGLTLTLAVNELATRHLVSGTARITGALMTFLGIGFGVALGTAIAEGLLPQIQVASEPIPLPAWTLGPALLVTSLAFVVLFRAAPEDSVRIMVAGALAFGAARLASSMLGLELSAFVAAFVVGAASNLHARLARRPACVTLIPALMLLVPGSFGFRGLTALLQQDVIGGVGMAFSMVLVAVAIVSGLLLANLIVPESLGAPSTRRISTSNVGPSRIGSTAASA